MTVKISDIAKNMEPLDDYIWVARSTRKISYPQEGNDSCYSVEDRSFWFRHRNSCILEVIKKYPPGGAFFDIGGGNGYVSAGLSGSGVDTVLIEPGLNGARNAVRRGVKTVVCSTLEDAGFIEKTIPAAGLFDVIEHFEDDEKLLTCLRTLMADNGRLYMTVPAYSQLWSANDDFAGHHRRYTLSGLESKLAAAGFEVEYSTYFFAYLIGPIFLFRVLPEKLGMKSKKDVKLEEKEHVPSKIVEKLVGTICDIELRLLRRGRLPTGASCLIVARASGRAGLPDGGE